MEPLIEVADEELPPEARALLDPAQRLPEGVAYFNDYARPGHAAVAWWLGCFACLGLALLFAADIPQELLSEYTIDKVAGICLPLLALWGAFMSEKQARRYSTQAAQRKSRGARHGLFIAPQFILSGQREQWTWLHRSHVRLVRLRTLKPHPSGNPNAERVGIAEVEYSSNGGGTSNSLALRQVGSGLSGRDVRSHLANWLAREITAREPEPYQEQGEMAAHTPTGRQSWVDVPESALPDAAQSLLDPTVPIPDNVRFYVMRSTGLVKDAILYVVATLGTTSFVFFCSVKILGLLLAAPSLQRLGFALLSGACLLILAGFVAWWLFGKTLRSLALLKDHRRGNWRRGLFLGPDHLLLCFPIEYKSMQSWSERISCIWLRRSDIRSVRGRRYSLVLGGLQVDQVGYLDGAGDVLRWVSCGCRLSEIKPGPATLELWADWASLQGALVPGEKRGDWDWESSTQPGE